MNADRTSRPNHSVDFADMWIFFGYLFSGILYLMVFGYVFMELFSFETPVVSALFALFFATFATCLMSPICAGLGFLPGSAVSSLIALFSYSRIK
ncbi:hypothetical protein [Neisseria animalis]|uniref:hypothetical protein n=1 Tax=Neisseria animalis TaxID=492 RepID=UPI000F4E2D9F|nr:hypothetical protein [Neisseria animalis]VEE06245.1 Uncharacterised protein [Neisseria animalis]